MVLEVSARPDAAQHEDLGRLHRARGEQHLAPGRELRRLLVAALKVRDAWLGSGFGFGFGFGFGLGFGFGFGFG